MTASTTKSPTRASGNTFRVPPVMLMLTARRNSTVPEVCVEKMELVAVIAIVSTHPTTILYARSVSSTRLVPTMASVMGSVVAAVPMGWL